MGDTIKSFRDLRVWQSAQDLCVNIYKETVEFPKHEQFGLTAQMRRAAVSVPSNIAEGFGRRSAKEKEQFYHHSLDSLFELDTQLELALNLAFVERPSYEVLRSQIEYCKAMLIKLLKVNGSVSLNR
jgi:four helix bundle protein